MSFDLAFWYAPDGIDVNQAQVVYDAIMEEESGRVPDSPAVVRFKEDVESIFPDIYDGIPREEFSRSPWATALYVGPGFVVAPISWSRSTEVSAILKKLAARHGLICYDPQARTVTSPN